MELEHDSSILTHTLYMFITLIMVHLLICGVSYIAKLIMILLPSKKDNGVNHNLQTVDSVKNIITPCGATVLWKEKNHFINMKVDFRTINKSHSQSHR